MDPLKMTEKSRNDEESISIRFTGKVSQSLDSDNTPSLVVQPNMLARQIDELGVT